MNPLNCTCIYPLFSRPRSRGTRSSLDYEFYNFRSFVRSFVRIGSKIKYDKRMRSKKKKIQTGRLFFLSFFFFFRTAFELKLRWSFLHQHRDRCVPGTRVTLVMKSRHRARTTLETPRAKHQSEDERTKSPTMPINEMETVVASTREHGRERKKN